MVSSTALKIFNGQCLKLYELDYCNGMVVKVGRIIVAICTEFKCTKATEIIHVLSLYALRTGTTRTHSSNVQMDPSATLTINIKQE
jgi:hypothetical protein